MKITFFALLVFVIGSAPAVFADYKEDLAKIEKAEGECLQRSKSNTTYLGCRTSARQQIDDLLQQTYDQYKEAFEKDPKLGKEGARRLERLLAAWPKFREADCKLLSLNANAFNEALTYESCLIVQTKLRFLTFDPYYIK